MARLFAFFKTNRTIIITILFFVLGIGIGIGSSFYLNHFDQTSREQEVSIQSYHESGKLTNPILDCEIYGKNQFASLEQLDYKISNEIQKMESSPSVKQVAYYFREMKNGGWVGIDEKVDFAPASLLNEPLMMAAYKKAEKDPKALDTEILYVKDAQASLGFSQNIVPSVKLEKGLAYPIKDILTSMIAYSDNDAQQMMVDFLTQSEIDETYVDLGLEIPGVRQAEDIMSVKDYATFFRILYNASYLSRDYSEAALQLLVKTEFNGLTGLLPPGMIVAHKFGERGYLDETGQELKQLHDCGIVYHPIRPYLLCIMTRGYDFEEQKKSIQSLSKMTYDDVVRRSATSSQK